MNKLTGLLLISFIFSLPLFSQNIVKGKVSDSSGIPLSNVSVIVQGTKSGTRTDKDGNFSFSLPAEKNYRISFSSIGYSTQTIVTEGKSDISVSLKREVTTQEDVVVIGYQTVRRKDLLASVSSVSAKDLKDIPINSAAEALNGRLAGVTATTAEGSPDAEVRVRVRGGMSITGDNSPLYIVDGVQVENGLSAISPQDIQSIDVLKDAAAAAIYGARGANGVIIITTKTGKPGKLKVSYNGFVGVRYLPKTLDVLSPYDYVIYQSERSRGSGTDSTNFLKNFGTTWDTLANYKNASPVNWQNEVFGKTGITQTHNVSASGGNKLLTYNFGYTYNDEKAIVLNSKYQRHLLNFKGDYKITKKIKAGLTMRYTDQNVYGAGVSDTKGSSYNRLRNAVKYRPFLSVNQEVDDTDPLADPNVGNGLNLTNPIQLANAEYRRKTTDVFNTAINFEYKITKHLSFKTIFSYDHSKLTDRQFSDTLTPYATIQGGKKPIVALDTTFKETYTNSNVLSYSLKNFRNKHDFDVLVGEETYDLRTESRSSLFRNYPTPISYKEAFTNTSLAIPFAGYPRLGKTRYTNFSFFGRATYSFMDKYSITLNGRADGASKFAPGKQWGKFPSGAVAWKVHNEKFMEKIKFINQLKLRVGLGTIGNNRIDDYLFLTTFRNDGAFYYGLNNTAINAFYSAGLVNENLRWESTVNRNIGLDLSLFKRIDLTVDVYNNDSKDLLLFVPIASTFGYASQFQNIGKTNNKGVELQLNASILQRKKESSLSWNSSFNISFNKNKVVALGKNQNAFFPDPSWGVSGQPADYIIRIGDPVGSMWGLETDGFYKVEDFDYNPSTWAYTLKAGVVNNSSIIGPVQPGSIKFKDLNGDGLVDLTNDRKIIGNPTPKFTGGFNQQFGWKQWDASVFVNFSYGNDIYNANRIEFTNGYTNNANMLSEMQDRWRVITPTGQTAQWVNGNNVFGIAPADLSALNSGAKIWQPLKGAGAFYPHSWAIEDGSFLRINNITIGYTLPVRTLVKWRMSKLRFYATGNNLAVFSKYTGYDPEVSVKKSGLTPGLDYSAYPKSRSFIFGVNATF